jgi:hypothetical protein
VSARLESFAVSGLAALLLAAYGADFVRGGGRVAAAASESAASASFMGKLAELVEKSDAPVAPPAASLGVRSLSAGLPAEGHWRGQSIFADLDGDGRLDLFTALQRWDRCAAGEGLHVWRGDGAGQWTAAVGGLRRDLGSGGTDVADLDGDGQLDLVFAGQSAGPQAYLGDGAGRWRPSWSADDIRGPCADVATGDFDGDGRPDLAAVGLASGALGLVVYRGVGRGVFEREEALVERVGYGTEVVADDLDGDGRPELLAATSAGPRVWKRTDEGWRDWSERLEAPDIGGSDLAIDASDLDGEGTKELLVAGMSYSGHPSLRIFRRQEGGWVAWGQGLPDDEAYVDAAFAQLDPAGPLSIVAAGKFGVTVVSMTQPGVFQCSGRLPQTEGVLNLCAGDVDGDGRDEIAVMGSCGVQVLSLSDPRALHGAAAVARRAGGY